MTYYELAFKLQHECPYNAFSKMNPGALISHWCNWNKDILEIAHRDVQDKQLQKDLKKLVSSLGTQIVRKSYAKSNLQVVLQQCACDKLPPPTLQAIEQRNCLELQPAVYADGWELYRVIAFSERDIKDLFKDLEPHGRVQIISRRSISEESMRDTFLVSTSTLFGDLTEKQARALIRALDSGYYSFPRRENAGEIAERLGVPRTSFVDHLRKAENKVLLAVGPYLRLKESEP